MKSVLQIGPSTALAKGGMSRVIGDLAQSDVLAKSYRICAHASYVDGSLAKRLAHSVYAYLRLVFTYQKYDLFHIHTATRGSCWRKGYYLRFLKKHHKPAVLHIHGAEFQAFYDGLPPSRKARVQGMLLAADRVIVLSQAWHDFFARIAPAASLAVIENAVDTNFYRAEEKTAQAAERFLFLGRFGARKGAFELVEAMAAAVRQRPHLRLTMAGDGNAKGIRALIQEKGLEGAVTVYDWVSAQKKRELFQTHGTLVLPSHNEGLPMAILEAMSAGLAVIATPVGGIPELIRPESGWLVPAGDVQALASALLLAAAQPEELKRMGAWNRAAAVARFSLPVMHRRIQDVYEQVLEGRPLPEAEKRV